jgi:hypothetical protein
MLFRGWGNRGEEIFRDRFLGYLAEGAERYGTFWDSLITPRGFDA